MSSVKEDIILKLESFLKEYIICYSYGDTDNYMSKYIKYEDMINYLLENFTDEDIIKNVILNYEYESGLLDDYTIINDKKSKVYVVEESC